MKKKMIAALLTLCMVVGMATPPAAAAQGEGSPAEGNATEGNNTEGEGTLSGEYGPLCLERACLQQGE